MAVLAVYNTLTLPGTTIYMKTDYFRQMAGRAPRDGEKVTLVVTKERLARRDLKEDSFYPIGISGAVQEINDNGFMSLLLKTRVNVEEVSVLPDGVIDLSVTRRPDIEDLDPERESERLASIRNRVIRFADGYRWGEMVRGYAAEWESIADAAAALAPWMSGTNEGRYALLAEDSQTARFDALEKMLYENLEMMDVSNHARSAQEEDYQKIYRESAIKQQMEYLQKELDELHPENVSELRMLEKKLQESAMNDDARKEGERVLRRLKASGENGAESGMLTDYLELLTSLPWEKEPAKKIPLREAAEILEEDHHGLERVKKRILQQIAVMNLKGSQTGSILLFVGAPGTGKTSIGQSIAKALGREYVRVSLGGVRDEADIRGHRRTYIGSMPGRIIDGIRKCGVSNPVMVLDEVDKLSQSYNGDPASALLEVLDPEQYHTFTDHYLNVPYDLSDVFFICTANTADTIPEPLLNRMEVIPFQGYTPLEKEEIAKKHLLPKAMAAAGLPENSLVLEDDALRTIIEDYTREGGVRGLKKRMDLLCRSAAVKLVEEDAEEKMPIRITKETLSSYMEGHPLPHRKVKEETRAGVVTGLAWTGAGGDCLFIETMFTKGSGKLLITGRLGDVMKESAQIAVSLVKSLYPEKAELFEKNDLHIHVPDGATPKDGPSAGITLTTAIASLVLGKPVRPVIAMTGEINLQGDVRAIGGLPEKLMAAQRYGVQTVFIPAENTDDLSDVPASVKESLTILPVKTADEVLKRALGSVEDQEQKAG